MSIVYSLDGDDVKETITTPEVVEVRDLGLKPTVLIELETDKINNENIIAAYEQKNTDLDAKIALIIAL